MPNILSLTCVCFNSILCSTSFFFTKLPKAYAIQPKKMRWIKQSQGVVYNAVHVMIRVFRKKTKFDKEVVDDIFTERKPSFFREIIIGTYVFRLSP
jgi:hypothetical protein